MPPAIFFLKQYRPVSWPWLATEEGAWVPTKLGIVETRGFLLASETSSSPRPDLASTLIAVDSLCKFRSFPKVLAAILRSLIIK